MRCTNVDNALAKNLLMLPAETVTVKGSETREILLESFFVENPLQRITFNEERKGNIFAVIAETLWMFAGRNDLNWLERYIPQCKKWSDDGEIWRAAYGPRLRNWPSPYWREETPGKGWMMGDLNQIEEVLARLKADPDSRQAIISLWDPARDNIVGSKDYPCNNLLHFIIRNNRLNLKVSVRSNDLIYGFSHVDFFGWSVLLQLMAHWLDVQPGVIKWDATSLHIYKRHYRKADAIVNEYFDNKIKYSVDSYPDIVPVIMDYNDFDMWLSVTLNDITVLNRDVYPKYSPIGLMATMKRMLTIYNYYLDHVKAKDNNAANVAILRTMVESMDPSDFRYAAQAYFVRTLGNVYM